MEKKSYKGRIKRINSDIKAIKEEIKILKSSESGSATRQQTSGGNKSVRGLSKERRKSWRVLRAVLTFPLLGKFFVRDFSALKSVLVEGKWESVVEELVPAPGAGTTAQSTNVQFC